MAVYTKIYPDQWFTPAQSPPWFFPSGYQAGWDVNPTSSSSFSPLTGQTIGSGTNSVLVQEFSPATPITIGMYRWTSRPLKARTIAGTFDMVIGAFESNAAADFSTKVFVYITDGQTDTVRGVLVDFEDTSEWPTTAQGISLSSPQAIASLDVQDGDMLVIEIGLISRNASSTNYQGRLYSGAKFGSPELTVGDTNVTTHRGYFTFSGGIDIDEPAVVPGDVISGNEQLFIYDGTTGELKRIIPASGSLGGTPDPATGAQFSDGTWVFAAQETDELLFYDADFNCTNVVAAVGRKPRKIIVDSNDDFYVGYRGNNSSSPPTGTTYYPRKFDRTGALLASYAVTLGAMGPSGMALDEDAGILYYTSRDRVIRRYDVVNDIQLADFVTLPTESGPTYSTKALAYDIAMLSSGGFLVADLIDVKRLDGVGTITQRYTRPNIEDWQTIAYKPGATTFASATIGAPDSSSIPTSINPVVQGATGPGTALAALWNLASGTVVFELLQDIDPDTGGSQRGFSIATIGGTGVIIVNKIVIPTDSTDFDFIAGGGLSPGSFTLGDGDSRTYSNVAPGDGYSIQEEYNPNYVTSIDVSNGSNHLNISVDSGETVTVTVTNTRSIYPVFETEVRYIRRLRRAPHLCQELKQMRHTMLQVDVDAGVSAAVGQGDDATINLRWSDDAGYTWSNEYPQTIGRLGARKHRVIWRRLGSARDRVYEVTMSDPVPWVLVDAFLEIKRGTGN